MVSCRFPVLNELHGTIALFALRRAWQPTPVFLPGEFHGQGSLVGCSSQSRKESNIAEVTEHARTNSTF